MENFPKINNVSERKKFEVSFSNALDLIEKTIEENLKIFYKLINKFFIF